MMSTDERFIFAGSTRATRIRLALPILVDPLDRFINIVGRTLGELLAPSGRITVYRKPVDFMEG